jgi:hypothetical protein
MDEAQAERLQPIHVTIPVACQITGDSRSSLYDAINRGELTPIKSGWRTLLIYKELVERCAARPVGLSPGPLAAIEVVREKSRRRKAAAATPKSRKRKSKS